MKKYFVLAFLFLIISAFNSYAVELKLIRTIGDDRDDYTFFILNSAVLSGNKDIFVLDGQGHFVAKYDWAGKFICRTGQKGKGPSDYYYPRSLNICNNKIFLLDNGNRRIVQMNLGLTEFNYYKFDEKNRFGSHFFALKDGTFIGVFSSVEENRKRIGIIDKKGSVVRHFFNEYPIQLKADKNKSSNAQTKINLVRQMVVHKETEPIIALDANHNNVLISFSKPDNPICFYLYSINDGRLIRKFDHILPEKYKFMDYYINIKSLQDISDRERKAPQQHFAPFIYSMFVHHNHFIVLLWLQEYQKAKVRNTTAYLLIFNQEGKLTGKISLESQLRLFYISGDGYALGSRSDESDEITKLYIYKLVL